MPHAAPGVLPNKAMHLTALRAAGDRHDVRAHLKFSGTGGPRASASTLALLQEWAMTSEQSNLATVWAFFEAVQSGAEDSEMATFYAEDVIQEEFPNAFLPNGATRGLKELQAAAARGRAAMASQTFEILNTVASGNTVVVESSWTGTLAVPISEQTPAGSVMRARFAQICQFEGGKIVAQRNYDCFYPW